MGTTIAQGEIECEEPDGHPISLVMEGEVAGITLTTICLRSRPERYRAQYLDRVIDYEWSRQQVYVG